MGEEISGSVNISVSVTDGENSVSGATVTVGEVTGTTGSAGGCTLSDVPIGESTVTVTADGYTNYSETINITSETTTLSITLTSDG